jgi:hypothetical protein
MPYRGLEDNKPRRSRPIKIEKKKSPNHRVNMGEQTELGSVG